MISDELTEVGSIVNNFNIQDNEIFYCNLLNTKNAI